MRAVIAGWCRSPTARLLLRGVLNALGLLIILFGLGLLMFCVVVLGHDVLPLIAAPDTAAFQLYRVLLITFSFNIIFHYVCATAFSARLGRGPSTTSQGKDDLVVRVTTESEGKVSPHIKDDDDEGEASTEQVPHMVCPESLTRRQGNETVSSVPQVRERACCCCPTRRTQGRTTAAWLGRTLLRVCLTGQLRPPRVASVTVLRELEHVACGLASLPPSLRRYRLLDDARRYCRRCARLKAPREHHCSICNDCVPKMDHHCPWLNNCVDVTNERNFYLFIVWLWLGALTASVVLLGTTYIVPQPLFVARGYGLDALPVCFTLALVVAMFVCMCFFLVNCTAHMLSNTTPIEYAIVQDRQERVFGSTGFVYRNPYDLGPWRNVLAFFATAQDPFLRDAQRRLGRRNDWRPRYIRTMAATTDEHDGLVAHGSRDSKETYNRASRAARIWHTLIDYGTDILLLLWLTVPPSMRDNDADGLHYITLDEVIRYGEQQAVTQSATPFHETHTKSAADTLSSLV